MNNPLYINYNGKLFLETEKIFSANNRAFKYGDAIFETIRIINGKLCFLADHFERLKKGIDFLQMKSCNINFDELTKQMEELVLKNKIDQGGRLRITVFREAEGFYIPINQSCAYVIEVKLIEQNLYELNQQGLKIDIYNAYKRSTSKLSNIKTTNDIPQILAGLFAIENQLDDCIILNKHNRIAETVSSNIFLFKKNNIYTPSLEEGCMEGVMRKQLLQIAANNKINVFEGMLNANVMLQTDEVFLTNVLRGVQWVQTFKEKTFVNDAAKMFVEELNKIVMSGE